MILNKISYELKIAQGYNRNLPDFLTDEESAERYIKSQVRMYNSNLLKQVAIDNYNILQADREYCVEIEFYELAQNIDLVMKEIIDRLEL
jgi:hypothetical protein